MKTAAFEVSQLLQNHSGFDKDGWQEFFRNEALFAGVYVLTPGGEDTQDPHAEDEIYYVLEGQGELVSWEGERETRQSAHAGSVLFVSREVRHRFENFSAGLKLLVFFATNPK
ncbi:MAG: cupin domain-containing protein [Deltaproteobacteria bacterium]|nr:cupin domain-containing protein [Deltaproteobacteria bacterium]MBI3294639.1 cupin domain-containing protein [Deltaproteobacteria bacterium]